MGNETASARKRCGRRRAPEPRTGCHCARGNESPASRFTELEPDSAAQAIVAQDRSISHQRKKTVSGSRTTPAPTAPAFPLPYSPFPLLFASIVGKKLVAIRHLGRASCVESVFHSLYIFLFAVPFTKKN